MEAAIDTLRTYIESLTSVIYIPHFDFSMVDKLIDEVADGEDIIEYHEGFGKLDFNTKELLEVQNLEKFLSEFTVGTLNECILLLKDIHHYLDKPEIVSRIKHIAHKNRYSNDYYATIIIISGQKNIPSELAPLLTILELELPHQEQIASIIQQYKNDYYFDIDQETIEHLAACLHGLSEFDIHQILNQCYHHGGFIGMEDKEEILRLKYGLIREQTNLKFVQSKKTLYDIGGVDHLKAWLVKKSKIFQNIELASSFGVEIPKGVLLSGFPGTGKSLMVKAAANLFELPLFKLQLTDFLQELGEDAKEKFNKAIQIVEFLSPCLLWIDDLGMNRIANEHTSSTAVDILRLYDLIIHWLKSKEAPVFVIATSYELLHLPKVFLNSRIFDASFFLDLPTPYERGKIFEIHLRSRNKWHEEIDMVELIQYSENYCGADIELVVKNVITNTFVEGKSKVETEDLVQEINQIKPMISMMKDQMSNYLEILHKYDIKLAGREPSKLFAFAGTNPSEHMNSKANHVDQHKHQSLIEKSLQPEPLVTKVKQEATLLPSNIDPKKRKEERPYLEPSNSQEENLFNFLEERNAKEDSFPYSSDSISSDWDMNGDYSSVH